MITGTKKKEPDFLTVDDILQQTTGGYDIYMYYLGKVARIMKRPWDRDSKASWGIYPYNGVWLWKDLAREESGNAVHFVMRYFGDTLPEACNRIAWDFQLKPNAKEITSKPKVVTWDEPTEDEKNYVHITFSSQPFKDYHHNFWNLAGVTEEHCKKYDVYAVKDLAIKRKRVYIADDEPVFAYYAAEEDAVKIYFPWRGYDEFHPKFKNNVSGSYLWNYDRLMEKCGGGCEKGIIQKSMKDLLVTTLITDNVIATQNEQSKLLISEHTISKVNGLFKNVWMAFGSDDDGVCKSKKVTEVTGWNWVNPPRILLPDVNDFYGLAATKGLRAVENLLKSKNYL